MSNEPRLDMLTAEQNAMIPVYIERYTKVCLDTSEANFEKAEIGVRGCYRVTDLPEPRDVFYAHSLSAAAHMLAISQDHGPVLTDRASHDVMIEIQRAMPLDQMMAWAQKPEGFLVNLRNYLRTFCEEMVAKMNEEHREHAKESIFNRPKLHANLHAQYCRNIYKRMLRRLDDPDITTLAQLVDGMATVNDEKQKYLGETMEGTKVIPHPVCSREVVEPANKAAAKKMTDDMNSFFTGALSAVKKAVGNTARWESKVLRGFITEAEEAASGAKAGDLAPLAQAAWLSLFTTLLKSGDKINDRSKRARLDESGTTFDQVKHQCRSGNLWAGWYCFAAFLRDEVKWTHESLQGFAYDELAALNAGFIYYEADVAIVCDRLSAIHQDPDQRLHNDKGGALQYRDGWTLWYLNGIAVDEQIVMRPETQTLEQINNTGNAEVKRLRIERYGWDKYLAESKATVADTRTDVVADTLEALSSTNDYNILMCVCPSTARVFPLEVPKAAKSCEEAQSYLSSGLSKRTIKAS